MHQHHPHISIMSQILIFRNLNVITLDIFFVHLATTSRVFNRLKG